MQSSNNPQSADPIIILKILSAVIAEMQPADRGAIKNRLITQAQELIDKSNSQADGRRILQLMEHMHF